MQCSDLGPDMLEYLAGTLPDDRLVEIRTHLAQCQPCRDEVDATSEVWNELGATPAPRPSRPACGRVSMRRCRATSTARRSRAW